MECLESRVLLAAHSEALHTSVETATIRYDDAGRYYLDALPADARTQRANRSWGHAEPVTTDVPIFHSNPSAKRKIYLDFDGQIVAGTGWNQNNKGRVIEAPAFDMDGNSDGFSSQELHAIERIWRHVSEDYSPFELDVTTEAPDPMAFRRGSEAIRVLISTNMDARSGNQWFDVTGGVAYVGSWRWKSDTPVWVFTNNLKYNEKRMAEAAAHEVGHALGLGHDGSTEGDKYFRGLGSGRTGWAPIMGAGYDKPVTQWSRGEYEHANNRQNDLSVITSQLNRIEYQPDDHSPSFENATRLVPDSHQQVDLNGLITRSTDKDMFVFSSGAGRIRLAVGGVQNASNLDVEVRLYDAQQYLVQVINPQQSLSATLELDVVAGDYYLQVDGVGKGDPTTDGYSDYASIGQYVVSGSIPAIDAALSSIPPPVDATQKQVDIGSESRRSRAITIVQAKRHHAIRLNTPLPAVRLATLATRDLPERSPRDQALEEFLAEIDQARGWN